jgi:hypothetical protein
MKMPKPSYNILNGVHHPCVICGKFGCDHLDPAIVREYSAGAIPRGLLSYVIEPADPTGSSSPYHVKREVEDFAERMRGRRREEE